ncbi:unnamed protein product, partial [Tenebrio molitor]
GNERFPTNIYLVSRSTSRQHYCCYLIFFVCIRLTCQSRNSESAHNFSFYVRVSLYDFATNQSNSSTLCATHKIHHHCAVVARRSNKGTARRGGANNRVNKMIFLANAKTGVARILH